MHVKQFADRLDPVWVRRVAQTPPPWGPLGYFTYKRCVDVSTPVLCDDLTWRSAGELTEGQGIIGFDEEVLPGHELRQIRRGTVVHNAVEEAECLGVELEDGTVVYATPDHPWLVQMSSNSSEWRQTKDLARTKKGGPVYLMRPFGPVWDTDKSWEAGYLAAAYDGEGNMDRLNGVVFVQVANPMLIRVERLLTDAGVPYTRSLRREIDGRQKVYGLRTHGLRNLFSFLGRVQPCRLMQKFAQHLRECPKLPALRCAPSDLVRVVQVFDAGVRKIAVLSTDISTHFTAGFASHNTYARRRDDLGRTEQLHETLERCVNGVLAYGGRFTIREAENLFLTGYRLLGLPGGRMLWQLGTPTVDRLGGDSLFNCWWTETRGFEDLCFTFDRAMLGGGVGFRASGDSLPRVLTGGAAHVASGEFSVPDTREGWVELLRRVYRSYFVTGVPFTYDTRLVRPAGSPILGFGGTASGPGPLVEGVEKLVALLDSRVGRHLSSVDVVDLHTIQGEIVKSGNVRRTALIGVGDPSDGEYLRCKRWDLGHVPGYRGLVNLTVECDDVRDLSDDYWHGFDNEGEQFGLMNGRLIREREDETRVRWGTAARGYRTSGCNPCAEIALAHREPCCLVELFAPKFEALGDFAESARLLYRVAKTCLQLPFGDPETAAVVKAHQRIGVGVTGLRGARWGDDEYREVYESLRAEDARYSKELGVNHSVTLTTVKPSGTLSLLPGVQPGIHGDVAEHYVRRIRVATGHPLIDAAKRHGYFVEVALDHNQQPDRRTQIVSFPVSGGVKAGGAIEQLEFQARVQRVWSDNCVSATITFRDDEVPAIKAWLAENYRTRVKTTSFMRDFGHGFTQTPYEPISRDLYRHLSQGTRPMTDVTVARDDYADEVGSECAGGSCPIR